ncbi:MAG: hypothetical protein H7329_02755 [Opitutaceae bacterium]|nr:hypothetical protein [Cytophagales bacterium]
MIYLNVFTGELIINKKLNFKINTKRSDLLLIDMTPPIQETEAGSNAKYFTISGIDNDEIDIVSLFYENNLQWISISLGKKYKFPRFTITLEEKKQVKKLLNMLGGEKVYSWGAVEFNEDNKGGIVSIIIKYNKE